MKTELQELQKQIRWMRWYIFISTPVLLAIVLFVFTNSEQTMGIIRTKGIIIEDSLGHDRILIGAPIPLSKNRVRTDSNLVRKYWSKNYGDGNQYMEWYKNYYHGAEGMVILNEQGFDRVLIGDKLADPNIGKRMFQFSGVLWNDKEGWELGGAGVNTTKTGEARSVVGVDDQEGEAVHIAAQEDGTKGLFIGGENGNLLMGMSKPNGARFKNEKAFTGIKYFDKKGNLLWQQEIKNK